MSKPRKPLLEFGQFRLDVETGHLLRADEITPLPPKAAAVLELFLRHPSQVLTKQQLVATVWPDTIVEEANLTQTIYLLRKTLSQPDDAHPLIETIPRVGYRWTAEVREVAATTAAPPPVVPAVATETASQVVPPSAPRVWWQRRTIRGGMLATLLLLISLSGIVLSRRSQPVVDSVAVLPFTTLGKEALDPSLGLGLADALITKLGALGQITVSPTAAILRYQENPPTPVDALAAGRELKVEAVLNGRVHQVDGRMRVTLQLLRVADGQTLWAHSFDESFAHLFDLQDAVAERSASALGLRLDAAQRRQLAQGQGTQNLEAYQLYVKGRYYWNKRQWEWTKKGIVCFEQALRLDPDYAQAWAGLADSYALWNRELSPLERWAKAKPAAEKALALNGELAEAHASLGFIKYKLEYDWRGAESAFRRAFALNPNYATARHWYGESLGLTGRFTEALQELRQAERLDPLSLAIKEDIGMVWFRARAPEQALAQFREVRELDPHYARVRTRMALVYASLGRYAEAVAEEEAQWLARGLTREVMAAWQQAYRESGWAGYCRAQLALAQSGKLTLNAFDLARLYVRVGEPEPALAQLEASFAARDEGPLRIKTEPEFDPLRQHPRFQALLARAGHTP